MCERVIQINNITIYLLLILSKKTSPCLRRYRSRTTLIAGNTTTYYLIAERTKHTPARQSCFYLRRTFRVRSDQECRQLYIIRSFSFTDRIEPSESVSQETMCEFNYLGSFSSKRSVIKTIVICTALCRRSFAIIFIFRFWAAFSNKLSIFPISQL